MTHALRRYTSNRGSALFMVISTMTALMIACVAMYFSVISSRTTEYATFFQQQSYQSASSITEMIFAGLNDSTSSFRDGLSTAMFALNEGETLTTGLNDFTGSFTPGAELSEDEAERLAQLGAYSVDITRLPNESVGGKECWTFDIATTSVVNGQNEIVHTYVHLEAGDTPAIPSSDGGVFAATGYVPNDAYLDGGYFLTDVFFDTEFTFTNMYGSKANFMSGDLATGGSLTLQEYILPIGSGSGDYNYDFLKRPTTWAIRGDLNKNGGNSIALRGGSNIFVGRDLNLTGAGPFNQVDGSGTYDVYVLGDMHMAINGTGCENVRLFIDGDIYVDPIANWATYGDVYCNGEVHMTGTGREDIIDGKWDDSAPGMTYDEVVEELEKRTDSDSYYKWKIKDSDVAGDFKIKLDGNNSSPSTMKPTFTIAYPGSESANDATITNKIVTRKGTITGFEGNDPGNDVPLTIVIDTGDDPNNVITLRVKPYLDIDGDGKNETFAWFPGNHGESTGFNLGINKSKTILVKGRGSVVIDIPEGTTYQDASSQQFMHYSWFVMLGGKEENKAYGSYTYKIYNSTNLNNATAFNGMKPAANAAQFIHRDCGEGSDSCTYEKRTKIGAEGKEKEKECIYCGEPVTFIFCETHGKVLTYCTNPDCESNEGKEESELDPDISTFKALCNNRLDKPTIDAYLNGKTYNGMSMKDSISITNSEGVKEVVYPTTNIFLVNSNESSEIRFSQTAKEGGGAIMQNSFYGYVYAPYMTFKAMGSSGTAINRFFGGLTVSDYVLDDGYAFTGCYPEVMPTDLMSKESLESPIDGVPKNWKITFGSN